MSCRAGRIFRPEEGALKLQPASNTDAGCSVNPLSCGHAFEADPFQTEVQELFFSKPAQGKAKGQMVAQPARVKTPDDGGKNRTSAICWRLAQGDPALWGGQRTSLRSSAAAGRARGAPAAWGPQGGDSQRGMPLWKALR